MENKQLLIQLYANKDSKRKLALFQAYSSIILMDASLKFIQSMLNKELGADLVSINDLKYIRHHYKTKDMSSKKPKPVPNFPISKNNISDSPSEEISWTNPDEMPTINKHIKSKFSN